MVKQGTGFEPHLLSDFIWNYGMGKYLHPWVMWDVIIHPPPNLNGILGEPALNLERGRIMNAYHSFSGV